MKITEWFVSKLRVSTIGEDADPFFKRYVVLKCRFFSIYLHEFFRSDRDTCLHDHPWGFVAFVLKEGYREQMRDGWHWRKPGSILFRPAKTAHRIVVWPNQENRTWSLVIVGRKVRDWGFWTPQGWHKWEPGYTPICEPGEATP